MLMQLLALQTAFSAAAAAAAVSAATSHAHRNGFIRQYGDAAAATAATSRQPTPCRTASWRPASECPFSRSPAQLRGTAAPDGRAAGIRSPADHGPADADADADAAPAADAAAGDGDGDDGQRHDDGYAPWDANGDATSSATAAAAATAAASLYGKHDGARHATGFPNALLSGATSCEAHN